MRLALLAVLATVPIGLPAAADPVAPEPLTVPVGLVTAPPTDLAVIAVTEDGTAAATGGSSGAARIWPALDGTREPVVAPLSDAHGLAIARDGDELALFGVDPLGTAELVRASLAGAAVARVRLASPRPIRSIVATSAAALALLDDGTLAAFDLRGARTAVLAPPSALRIVSLLARGDRALALVDGGGKRGVSGRWIALGPAPRWDGETPVLQVDPAGAQLSPDHARIAGRSVDHMHLVIASLTTGRVLETPFPYDDGAGDSAIALGFTADGALAIRQSDALVWWRRGALGPEAPLGVFAHFDRGAAASATLVVAAAGAALLVAAPGRKKRFLGYRVADAQTVFPTPRGFIVTEGTTVMRVDASLRGGKRYTLPSGINAATATQFAALDDHRALVFAPVQGGERLLAIDLDHPDDAVPLGDLNWGTLKYEPSTHLYAVETDRSVWFGHFHPKTGAVDPPAHYDIQGYATAFLTDPRGAGGAIATLVWSDGAGQRVQIDEIDRVDAAAPLEAVRGSAVHLRRGREVGNTSIDGFSPERYAPPNRRVSPDGELIATVDGARVSLRDKRGAERWTIANPGVTDARWLGGDLVLVGGGLARVDLATGALVERRCGWGFGAWDAPDVVGAGGAGLCVRD